MNTNSRISSRVGPKPNSRLSITEGPPFGARASMVTFWRASAAERSELLANDGI